MAQPGPRGRRPRHRGYRLVHRRHAGHAHDRSRSARRWRAFALVFGPADYFALMVFGLMFAVVLARGSLLKAVAMILAGILLVHRRHRPGDGPGAADLRPAGAVRRHRVRGARHGRVRLRRDRPHAGGCRAAHGQGRPDRPPAAVAGHGKSRSPPILRGTVIGAFLGLLPGNGAVLGPSRPMRRRSGSPKTPRVSAKARSRAWPDRNRPIMPARRPRSCRC